MSSTADTTPPLCPQCGRPLSARSPKGLCPACLMKVGFDTQCAAPADSPQAPGLSISEIAALFPQLEILELLGKGGMGVVYKVRQRQLDRFVALKILSPQLSQDPAFAERFSREAKALAQLNHPNIVSIYDFGKAGSCFYLLMEFMDGMSLWEFEQRKKPLSPAEALAIIPKLCEALQYAHDEGVAHRDIKPGNILIDKKGRVKIADFGLAKIVGRTDDFSLTQSGTTMGTPHYMAPEQMERPLEVDHRADLYSLGVVFYEMLTGELPIGRFAAPSDKVQIDVRLDEVVLRALEKEPTRRYQQASELKTNVERISAGPAPAPRIRNRKRLVSVTVTMGLFLCAILALTLPRHPEESTPPATPPGNTPTPVPTQLTLSEAVTLDNDSAVLDGIWAQSKTAPDKYGADYLYSAGAEDTPTAAASFYPDLKTPGEYHVEEWHSVGANRSTGVKWIVASKGKTNTIVVDQTEKGGRWVRIDTAYFAGGTNEYVRVQNDCGPTKEVKFRPMAVVDAVRFVLVP